MTNLKDVTWKMFKVGDVINIKSSNGIFHAVNVTIENEKNKNNHPYVVRTSKNNGIRGYIVEDEDKLNPGNTISFAQDTAQMFYQAEPYFTGNKVKVLEVIGHPMTEKIALFLISVLKKGFSGFGWGSSFNTKKMCEVQFPLPITATGSIDWNFMTDYIRELEQERIRELEQERIRELDAYLKAAGLDSYELDAEDKRVLALYREALEHKNEPKKCELQFGEFKLDELFKATVGDTDIKRSDINGRGDFVITAGVANCGVLGKSDVAAKVVAANTITVDMFGNCQYRDFPYKMVTHARVLSLKSKTEDFNRETGLYISTVLRSVLTHFDYNNMCSWNKISDFAIQLPVTTSGDINFDFMEKYIKAIEKVSIANVVKYKDKVIAATKQVVNGNSVSAAAAA